jgi:hypothetical protein
VFAHSQSNPDLPDNVPSLASVPLRDGSKIEGPCVMKTVLATLILGLTASGAYADTRLGGDEGEIPASNVPIIELRMGGPLPKLATPDVTSQDYSPSMERDHVPSVLPLPEHHDSSSTERDRVRP